MIRYLVQDDPKQTRLATQFIEETISTEAPGFLSHIVLCETVWVLEDCYSQSRAQIATILQTLFTAKQIVVQEPELAWKALRFAQAHGIDFSDALIGLAGARAGCNHSVTFDKSASRLKEFELLS